MNFQDKMRKFNYMKCIKNRYENVFTVGKVYRILKKDFDNRLVTIADNISSVVVNEEQLSDCLIFITDKKAEELGYDQ